MATIILDIEFTGLDNTYITDNEIVQVKMIRLSPHHPSMRSEISLNFNSDKPIGIYGRMQGMPERYDGFHFNEACFTAMMNELGVYELATTEFIGFSTGTDWQMLGKYGIKRLPNWIVTDIVDTLRLSLHERTLAEQGRSMEVCHYLLTGQPYTGDHSGMDELRAIRDMYLIAMELEKKERMEYVPFGHCAGMPIQEYVRAYRRNADGYRFNNSDLFASAMDWYIEQDDLQFREQRAYEDEDY